MEKLKVLIKSKAYIYISLLVGLISLLLIGQERQFGIFAWIAPLFLLQFSRKAKPLLFMYLFIIFIVAGFITQKTHNLFNNPVFGIINSVSYAFVHFIIYLTDRLLFIKGKKFQSTLIFPSVYVVIEVLVTSLIGTSGVLAQSQLSFIPLAQLSAITGIHGITFIICWFASTFYWLLENEINPNSVKKGVIYFGTVFIIILSFGCIRLLTLPSVKQTIKVATVSGPFNLHHLAKEEKETLIQLGNTPLMKIPSYLFSSNNDISIQINNTRKAAESGAKIIVWNEAALFINQKQRPSLIAEVKNISKEFNAYILIAFFEESISTETKPINNKSILITNDGRIGWEYRKSHPTPAEIPLVNSGDSSIPFIDTEYGIIGNVICYDYDFPSFLRQANKNNIDIMLVPAYDWKGFASLHSNMAQFETLQSGRLLIRSNGNGINIITNNHGKIISELNTFTSKNRILYANLPLNSSKTIYAKTGNLLFILCFIILTLSIAFRISIFPKPNKQLNPCLSTS